MLKKSISSVELAALVNELQFLIKSKISQLYHREREVLLQFHVPRKGKQLLKVIPGKWLCLTRRKETSLAPSSFCMQLRKYLDNAFVESIYQKDSERVVVFELEKKGKYFLIIELFSKGNLVLTNDKYQIIAAWEKQKWKDRVVKPGEKYIFPFQGINWKTITEKELESILKKSGKKNLATTLATEIGLGGLYAEEVCRRAGQDKDLLPREGDAKGIIQRIKEIVRVVETPRGFIYEEEIAPFPLKGWQPVKETTSFNEAIDTLKPWVKPSPYEQKIKVIEIMIAGQEEAIANLQEKAELNTKKGELIYEKYIPLRKMLEIVNVLRKTKSWEEISRELRKEKKIRGIDLKGKKVLVDL